MKVSAEKSEIQLTYLYILPALTLVLSLLTGNYLSAGALLTTGSLLSVIYWKVNETAEYDQMFNRKLCLAIVSAMTLIGFWIRLENLGSPSLWYDEAISAIAVEALLEKGRPILESGKVYWRSLPHLLLSALSAKILGISDFSLRLPSVITGTLIIPITYLTGEKFFEQSTGLIATILIAFSTWEIVWSRQVRMYSLLQLLFLLSILQIYLLEKKTTLKKSIALTITILLAAFTHVTGYILPVVAILYFFYARKDSINLREILKILLPAGTVAFVLQIGYFSYSNLFSRLTFSPENIDTYLSWISSTAPSFLLLGITGVLPSIKENRKAGFLMAVSSLPVLYIYFLHVETAASRYLYVVLPFFAIWSGLALTKVFKSFNPETKIARLFLILLLFSTLLGGNFASGEYNPGLNAPQPDFKSAYRYVQTNRMDEDTVISGWTPPAVHYLDSPPKYTLVGRYFTVPERSFKGEEQYSGAEFITNQSQLRKIVKENERGWIVLDERAWRGQRDGVKATLQELELKAEFHEIKVWHWDETSLVSENTSD
ncbi:MAG: glycosyltransferase family 39 protein [Candidatus Nanosalina sp.]